MRADECKIVVNKWKSMDGRLLHIGDNKLSNYPNCFRYLDGDMPMAFVNTRTKCGKSWNPTI